MKPSEIFPLGRRATNKERMLGDAAEFVRRLEKIERSREKPNRSNCKRCGEDENRRFAKLNFKACPSIDNLRNLC